MKQAFQPKNKFKSRYPVLIGKAHQTIRNHPDTNDHRFKSLNEQDRIINQVERIGDAKGKTSGLVPVL